MSNIVFFGTEDHSLIALRTLVEHNFHIAAVVTKPDTPKGRGHRLAPSAVKAYALTQDITVLEPQKLDELIEPLSTIERPVGVLVSYGKIIPNYILSLFSPGIINVHPSLLPLYRGPSPIESAIEHRDAKTGVTIMKLVKAMDAGPIYVQVPYALDQTETKPELYDTLFTLGSNLLVQYLPRIIDGSLQPTPQDEADATYCHLLQKGDGLLDLQTLTPGEAEARIRAHLGYPRTRLQLGPHRVIVTKAHAVITQQTALDIECKNGAFLSIDELIAPSGKRMSRAEFLRGYRF